MPKTPPVDDISKREMASREYGWALSVLKSSPELWDLFNKAVKKTWTQERFIAEVRGTEWFATHSEATRNYVVLKRTDPRTFEHKLGQTRASIKDAAVALGAQLSNKELDRISHNVLRYDWNDGQIRDTLAGAVRAGSQGTYGGQAAADVQQLQTLARRNGVALSDKTVQRWVTRISAGESIDGFEAYVREMASSAFPQWADRLGAGQDLHDIADPYRQSMAKTLELNDEEIDLFDPTIRKTLQSTDPDGKPMTKPLWQFEKELRQDKRWLETDNARETMMSTTKGILSKWGVVS